ncbi:hypothetical protein PVAG01_10837 [Phlyctema vagabunda]|uniref:BTB domain-containing protein n=1 Tax=Phlyctema vagabunda TaxID=108571 RepID=A0ABR4P3E1_9HELO
MSDLIDMILLQLFQLPPSSTNIIILLCISRFATDPTPVAKTSPSFTVLPKHPPIAVPTQAMSVEPKKGTRVPGFDRPDKVVTFIIGPSKQNFVVHKEFVCHYSPVLEAAFNSAFVEGQTQTYVLEDTTQQAFKYFVQWLYAQSIDLEIHGKGDKTKVKCDEDGSPDAEIRGEICGKQNSTLIEVWLLAAKFMVPGLQNHIIDLFMENHAKCNRVMVDFTHAAYAKMERGNPLRRLCIRMLAWHHQFSDFSEELTEIYTPELIYDLVKVLYESRKTDTSFSAECKMKPNDYYVQQA